MIIEESQLRPPSPKEMEAGHVSLERVRLQWLPKCWGWDPAETPVDHYKADDTCDCPETFGTADTLDAGFTTLELIEFHKQWAIPYEAFMVNDGYEGEKALDWTHLNRCPICQAWYLEGSDHIRDAIHQAVIKARETANRMEGDRAHDRR